MTESYRFRSNDLSQILTIESDSGNGDTPKVV